MTESIQSAEDFARRFIPEQFARLREVLASRTWPGSLALSVEGEGAWSFRIREGELEVLSDLEDDRLLTVSLSADDFSKIVGMIPSAENPKPSVLSHKLLRWDAETVNLVRNLPGSILLRFDDQATVRRVLLTPALGSRSFDEAACAIDCAWADLLDVQAGKQQPMDLFLAGKIRLSGNVEVALALAGLLL
jgi:hypothetical protein